MLILASQSPVRKALLEQAGLAFAVRSGGVNERAIETAAVSDGAPPEAVAERLAAAKALAVAGNAVIGADQVLAFEGRQLHKPADGRAARRQLEALRGKTHSLHAAVALAVRGAVVWRTVETAHLTMRAFTGAELDRVLALEGDAILTTVGGYRIEGPSVTLFEAISGDYFAILGLPLLPLLAALRQHAPECLP